MNNRIYYLDVLKGFSIFFVVVLHVSGIGLSREVVGSYPWTVCNIYDCLCRFVVPVFIMISGALLMRPDKEFHLLKSLKRLAIPLLLWSALYALLVIGYQYRCVSVSSLTAFLNLTFLAPTHNWFLFLLLGVYLLIPFLKLLVAEKGSLIDLFLGIWFLFGVLTPFMEHFDSLSLATDFMKRFCMAPFLQYAGYFVLGYKLSTLQIIKNARSIVLLLLMSCLLVAANVYGTLKLSEIQGSTCELLYEYMSPLVVFYSICIFLICKSMDDKKCQKPIGGGYMLEYQRVSNVNVQVQSCNLYAPHVYSDSINESRYLLFYDK